MILVNNDCRTVYIFYFSDDGHVTRIPYEKWKRISSGEESVKEFANTSILFL